MSKTTIIKVNENGSYFAEGVAFSATKWTEIVTVNEDLVEKEGKCSYKHLADECCISKFSAAKAHILVMLRLDNKIRNRDFLE